MTILKVARWQLQPVVPDFASMDDILMAYNADPLAPEPLARGDANPLWPFLESLLVPFGTSFSFPTLRGPGAFSYSNRLPAEQLDEVAFGFGQLAGHFQRITAAGGDVLNFPLFVQVPAALITNNMPGFIPGRSYLDESDPPVEVVRTFEEYWNTSSNFASYPQSFDGGVTYWAPTQNPWDGGAYWPMSVNWQINAVANVNLRTIDQYEASQPEHGLPQ